MNHIILKVIRGNIVSNFWLGKYSPELEKQNLSQWAIEASKTIKKNKNNYAFVEGDIYVSNSIVIGANGDLITPPGNTTISGRHCRLHLSDEGWLLVDLKSTNGTYLVRDREVIPITEPTLLEKNDLIKFGKNDVLILDVLEITGNYTESIANSPVKSKKIEKVKEQKQPLWKRIIHQFWH